VSKLVISDYGAAEVRPRVFGYAKICCVLKSAADRVPLLRSRSGYRGESRNDGVIYSSQTPKNCSARCCAVRRGVDLPGHSRIARSEQAARMVAMKAATTARSDMITGLTRQINTRPQASITNNVEVVSGADALARKVGRMS